MVRPLFSLQVQTLQHLWMSHLLLTCPCWTVDVSQSFRLPLADVLFCCISAGLVW